MYYRSHPYPLVLLHPTITILSISFREGEPIETYPYMPSLTRFTLYIGMLI